MMTPAHSEQIPAQVFEFRAVKLVTQIHCGYSKDRWES